MPYNVFNDLKKILRELHSKYENLPVKIMENEISEKTGVINIRKLKKYTQLMIEHGFIKVTNEGNVIILKLDT